MTAHKTKPTASSTGAINELDRYYDEKFADRGGEFIAAGILAGALILLLAWATTQTTFEQCRAIMDHDARMACYDTVASQEARPAKGGLAPALSTRN